MYQFCGSEFWNKSLTWDASERPDFTFCFEETVLLWVPCGLLYLFTLPSVISTILFTRKNKQISPKSYSINYKTEQESKTLTTIPWTVFSILKLLICLGFVIVSVLELVAVLWLNNRDNLPLFSVHWVSPIIKIVIFVYLGFVFNFHRRNVVYSSGSIFVFVLLYTLYSGINIRSILISIFDDGAKYYPEFSRLYLICRIIAAIFSVGLLLLVSTNEYNPDRKYDPNQTSGFLSKITFWWFTSIIIKGYRRPLVEDDTYNLASTNSSFEILEKFEHIVDKKQGVGSVKIAKLALQAYWKQLLGIAMLQLVATVLTFGNPYVMNLLITFLSSGTEEPLWRGFFYAVLMFIFPMFLSLCSGQYEYWCNMISIRVKTGLISMIYNKSLKLSTFGRKNYSTGEISNIMSVDSQKFSDFLLSINQLWSAPLTFAFAIYMLWQQMGVASLAGVVFMIVLVPFNAWISGKIRNRHMQVMKQKDGRAKMMNEILNGMKVLKLYAWENSFKDKIINLRGLEVAQMYKIAFFMGFMFFALSTAPFLVALLTFGIYVLMGNSLDPNKAFVSLSLFNIIRGPMGFLPMILSNGAMALVSMKRINKFLNEEEINESSIDYRPNPTYAISVQNGTFTWNRDASSATIRNINLDIPHGKLIALVGNVGSGKSSLLSGILGEMEKVSGSINVSGSVAYVPQQAWIQNAILRKNITFTSGFDERKYQNVIKACCLEPDLAILADGDQTEIGERGINLSGGQKQRISLARAVYSDSDIYLLDDPLSAVDAHVGKDLFDDVISSRGLLHDKTRILATHRISVLNQVDEIFVMKDGQIAERGTMNELIERKGDFADYLAEYLQEKHVDSEDDKTLLEYDEDEVEFLEHLTNKLGSIKKLNASVRSKSSNKSLRQRKDSKILLEKPKQNKSTSKGKLITSESTEKGSVTAKVYFKYFRTIGWGIILMATLCLFGQVGFQIVTSLWLSAWSDDGRKPENANNTSLRNKRLAGYASFGLGECIFSLIVVNSMNVAAMRASKLLHNSMISKIMHAPMAFFDSTPVGRILNRFTKDVDVADFSLGLTMRMTAMQFLRTIVSFVIISLETPIILAAIVPILIVYYFVQRLYIASSRQLKRIESTTRSPIYNHFGETVNGVNSIRAYRVQNEFLRESFRRIDLCNRCTYSSIAAARWLAIRIEFLGYSIVLFAALFAVLYRETLSPGMAALAISYSLDITSTVGMVIKFASDLETNIVSIERLIEYTEVESEAPYYAEQNRPTIQWPTHGKIHFEGYNTRYRDGLDLVVKDVSFEIRSQEKVGIVGRTGAGKSSLTLALFRIIEAAGGRILIDGIDIGKLGLYDLRSRITIIPQDPVLFTGTLRMNLDPFETYSEQEIWRSLELAHLKQFAQNVEGKLDYKITEGGENLSVGQRQLVCLARALLRKSKILVLDEATAAVDMETDSLIQETIRNKFSDCTIVTIAHRLNTVIDYDRILVLEQGRVQEYDSPAVLLQDQSSMFHSMAKDANLL